MCNENAEKMEKEMEREELRVMQKEEAIKRMEKLEMLSDVIEQFKLYDKLYRSENFRFNSGDSDRFALLYFLDRDETRKVQDWEKETGNLVYHVIRNKMEFGTCLSFLYVSKDPNDWEDDNADLEDREEGVAYPLVYVMNLDDEHSSEYGCIGIKPSRGGILRTA